MGIEVYRETIDYVSVLARQIDRVAELATKVFDGGAQRPRLKAFLGALWVLFSMSSPLVRIDGVDDEAFKDLLRKLDSGMLMHVWLRLLDMFRKIVHALERRGLLVRKQEILVGEFGGESSAHTVEAD